MALFGGKQKTEYFFNIFLSGCIYLSCRFLSFQFRKDSSEKFSEIVLKQFTQVVELFYNLANLDPAATIQDKYLLTQWLESDFFRIEYVKRFQMFVILF